MMYKNNCYTGRPLTSFGGNYGDSYSSLVNKINELIAKNGGDDLSWMNEFTYDEVDDSCFSCTRNEDAIYCGNNLVAIGVYTGDHYDVVFEKIDEYFNNTPTENTVVLNSIGDILASVPCGGQVVLNDVQNVNSDGTVVNTPVGVPFICSPNDVNVVIEDTDGNVLYTVTSNTPQEIQDSTFTLVDSIGGTLNSGSILAEGFESITAPNGTINLITESTSTPISTHTVLSGGSTNIEAPNSTFSVVDSDNTLVQPNGFIESGQHGVITIGDINSKTYVDGVLVDDTNIPYMETLIINIIT